MKFKHKKIVFLFSILVLSFLAISFFLYCPSKNILYQVKISAFKGTQCGLLILAENKEFFNKNQIKADIIWHETSSEAIKTLINGQADVAIISDYVFTLNSFSHPELEIFSSIANSNAIEIIARKDHNIKNPADLKGKKIGLPKNSILEYYFDIFLILNKISTNEIKVINIEPSEIDAAFLSGEIDATLIWNNNIYKLQQQLKDKIISLHSPTEQNYYVLMTSSKNWLENNPDSASALLKSFINAENFLNNNFLEAVQIIGNELKIDHSFLKTRMNRYSLEITLPQILLKILDEEGKWLVNKKSIPHKKIPNYLFFINHELLEKIDKNRISFYH